VDFKRDIEVEFLLRVLQHAAGNKNSQNLTEIQPVDWNKLVRLAVKHGVSPLLFNQLSRQKPCPVPDPAFSLLKYQYLQNLKNNITKTTHLLKILTILKSRGITMIPFKGPVIAELAYGDLGSRAFDDVDVLIKPNDLLKVYDLLKKKDWKPTTSLSERMKKLWIRSRRDLEFVSKNCVLDCHQQLTQGPAFFAIKEEKPDEGISVTLLNRTIYTLSAEATVLSICLNGTKDQWTSLKPITDLVLFLSSYPRLNWDRLLTNAGKMGILSVLLLGIELGQKLLSYTPPALVNHLIKKTPVISQHSHQIINRIFEKKPDYRMFYRFLFMFKLLDNWKFRLDFLGHFLFSPTPRDFSIIPLPETLYPLYYLIRPLRLGISSVYFVFKTLIHGSWEPDSHGKNLNGTPANRQ